MIADDDLDGWHRYPECVADQPDTPIDDEIEGDLLQYSSGTTGRPKGIKRELPHLPPAEVPGLMSGAGRLLAGSRGRLPQPRAALPHRAVGVVDDRCRRAGITTVVMEKFDAEGCLDAIQRHRVTHGQFVPVMFTRMLKLPESVRDSYDLSSLQAGDARRGAVPGRDQEADDRLVGADRRRVLRLLRGDRVDADHRRGLAGAPGLGRQADDGRAAHPRRGRQRAAPGPGRARSTSRAASTSSTSTTRRRPRSHATSTAGRPSATSAISTRRATST